MPASNHSNRGRSLAALLSTAALFVCVLLFTAGASAGGYKTVGYGLPLSGVSTFPADQPFHIAHGFVNAPSFVQHQSLGEYQVRVTVDGAEVKPSFIQTLTSQDPTFGAVLTTDYVFNFPDGMTGTHVFGTTYLGPCEGLVDAGYVTGPCDKQNDLTSLGPFLSTVTFVP
jgi:hypothetical protein